MSFLFAVILVGMGTYFCRAIFILAFANRKIPNAILVPLRYVAPATLTALIVTLLIDKQGHLSVGLPELAALACAAAVAHFSRSHIYTLFVGMGVFLVLQHLL